MPEPINFTKLADISPTTLVKTTSSTAKGLLVLLAVAGIGYAIYKAYVKRPDPTTTQNAKAIANYNYHLEPRQMFFGCANFKLERIKKSNLTDKAIIERLNEKAESP